MSQPKSLALLALPQPVPTIVTPGKTFDTITIHVIQTDSSKKGILNLLVMVRGVYQKQDVTLLKQESIAIPDKHVKKNVGLILSKLYRTWSKS